ncbi:MAG TPA: CaiB/BaiF CoA-transferase family protein, partial [Terriglobales bacterium]|nr:CaiB/BaiF CoA-transferase family protein [Terriglobales bacterium]
DLGAEVTKIETPGSGDPFRTWDKEPKDYSPSFCALNRNKKSITLDLKNPQGKEVFLRLAKDADVIVENLRPGVVDRLGIGYEDIKKINPQIIYCSISAFGQDGPYRDRPGYDTLGQSLSGLLSVLTDMEHPRGPGAAFSDHLAGIYGCYGILAAIAGRERKGTGQKVETSLLESTISFLGFSITQYLFSGQIPEMSSRLKTAGVYALVAGDGKPFVIHLSHPPKFWTGVTEVFGRPDLQTDPRTKDRHARIKNYDMISDILSAAVKSAPRDHWLKRLQEKDVPCAPINNFAEVFEDPQVKHLDRLIQFNDPEFGTFQLVKNGIRLSATPLRLDLRPPKLGEHNEETLRAIGFSAAEIETLRQKKVI